MGANSKDSKGFKGLVDLVSDLSDLKSFEGEVKHTSEYGNSSLEARKRESSKGQSPRDSSPAWTSSEASTGMPVDTKFVLWALVVIVLVILYSMSQTNSTNEPPRSFSSQGDANVGFPEAADDKNTEPDFSDLSLSDLEQNSSGHGGPSDPSTEVPSRYDDVPEYVKPSKGTSNVLSIPQIRWCIRGSMQIEAMRGIFTTNHGIDRFNEIVEDYNSRCGSYRYRQGNLALAQRQVEKWRGSIEAEARAEAIRVERNVSPGSTSAPSVSTSESQAADPEVVKEIQLLLRVLGFSPGSADGLMGPKTKSAVMAFQRSKGMIVTGQVNSYLLQALRREHRRRFPSNY